MTELISKIKILISNIKQVFYGQHETIELSVICFLAGGHLLLEDIPGVGKTTLARALAKSFDLEFKRVQFVPDLMPSDLIGVSVYNKITGEFDFKKGSLFTNVLLLDEINRGNTRTQSATLEAMAQAQISIDGRKYLLPRPYFIIATQNPFDFEGTFPLPESQLDRFMMCLSLGYLDPGNEVRMILSDALEDKIESLKPILSTQDCINLISEARKVTINKDIGSYIVELANQIRNEKSEVQLGISQRGTLALARAAQARALIQGRSYCTPDDIKILAGPVFGHRIKLTAGSLMCGVEPHEIVNKMISRCPVPM